MDVELISITGISVQRENRFSSGESVTFELKNSLTPGMYIVKVDADKKRWATKLQIK